MLNSTKLGFSDPQFTQTLFVQLSVGATHYSILSYRSSQSLSSQSAASFYAASAFSPEYTAEMLQSLQSKSYQTGKQTQKTNRASDHLKNKAPCFGS